VLFDVGTVGGLTDGQLLERFTTRAGEAAELAFAALVERHGPMVLRTCQAVLEDAHDAQDAFQATFLVLARKARSIRRREAIASWLHGVARRVAACAKGAAARRRRHERRAAEGRPTTIAIDEQRADLGQVLHEELDRLPERYRAPIVLCYLEGLTHEQAAKQLRWPVGTVRSRLARGRERLQGRLMRRGAVPAIGLLGTALATEVASAGVPVPLVNTIIRAAMSIAAGEAAIRGAIPPTVAALARGALKAMALSKLRMSGLVLLMVAATTSVGLLLHGALKASNDLTIVGHGLGSGPARPASARHVDRLDFGRLHVGALAEAEFTVAFQGTRGAGITARVEPPEFVDVKGLRIWKWGAEQPRETGCTVLLSVDTKTAGKRSGDLKVRLGDQVATIPVVASVVPEEQGLTKVLVVSSEFGGGSDQAAFYRPWFDLIDAERLDVSYMEAFGGLQFPIDQGPGGKPILPTELARYDVILLAEGGTVYLDQMAADHLGRFAESGRRLIVTASPALVGSVLKANLVLDPLGIHMVDKEPQVMGRFKVQNRSTDPLMRGVKTLSFFRPAPIQVAGESQAKLLGDGFIAVARPGKGEVIAIGLTLVSDWIGEGGKGSDNAQLLRNLLTTRRK
jgi:RNA polymerase sigma factor (sigma-70 family)